jgi:hypothetical protein
MTMTKTAATASYSYNNNSHKSREKWTKPTRDEWNLQAEKMGQEKMIIIGKARWIWHRERCNVDVRKRKRIDIDLMVARLRREIKRVQSMAPRIITREKKPEPQPEPQP